MLLFKDDDDGDDDDASFRMFVPSLSGQMRSFLKGEKGVLRKGAPVGGSWSLAAWRQGEGSPPR
jgi:hypothetical protein